jgi:hypothetical protein
MSLALNGTDGVTYNDGTLQSSAPVGRNRIINGNMTIDQRNAGASVNPAVSGSYYLDRFIVQSSVASKFKIGQQRWFSYSSRGVFKLSWMHISSAYTVGAAETFNVQSVLKVSISLI